MQYGVKQALAFTSLSGLAAGAWAGSAVYDNRLVRADDLIALLELDVGATVVAGEAAEVYVVPLMRNVTNTAWQASGGTGASPYAGVDAALTEGAGGAVKLENMIAPVGILFEVTANILYRRNISAKNIIGWVPEGLGLVVRNASANVLGTDHTLAICPVYS